jgi:hypothetical protein
VQECLSVVCLLAALSGGTRDATFYDDYRQAWTLARAGERPVLVILNPAPESVSPAIDVELLRRSRHRRELLSNYVVAVIDTSTTHGQAVHKAFQSPSLPRVAVLDRQQKWQIYRTSQVPSAEDWNLVLEKYRTGAAPQVAYRPRQCPT